MSVQTILLILAFICCVLAAAGVQSRIQLFPLGVALAILAFLLRF